MKLRSFFKKIDKKMIDGFIRDNQEEHLTLEFKTVSKADLSDRNDRKNFAISLSGFANSTGGIIVWGADARQNQQGIDCACGTKEIQPLSQLLSKLNEFSGQFVNPVVEGIKHKKIPTSGNKGFAVTLIPESDAGPHMAKGGVDRYYKRSGSSFYRMEHFDIEDMFGRRKKPKLSLFTVIKGGIRSIGPEGKLYESHIIVGIKNTGRGIAKYIYLALTVNAPYVINPMGLDETGNVGLNSIHNSRGHFVRYLGDSNLVIHPNSNLEITSIIRRFRKSSTKINDLVLEAEIRAEGMIVMHEKKVFSGDDIIKAAISDAEKQ